MAFRLLCLDSRRGRCLRGALRPLTLAALLGCSRQGTMLVGSPSPVRGSLDEAELLVDGFELAGCGDATDETIPTRWGNAIQLLSPRKVRLPAEEWCGVTLQPPTDADHTLLLSGMTDGGTSYRIRARVDHAGLAQSFNPGAGLVLIVDPDALIPHRSIDEAAASAGSSALESEPMHAISLTVTRLFSDALWLGDPEGAELRYGDAWSSVAPPMADAEQTGCADDDDRIHSEDGHPHSDTADSGGEVGARDSNTADAEESASDCGCTGDDDDADTAALLCLWLGVWGLRRRHGLPGAVPTHKNRPATDGRPVV